MSRFLLVATLLFYSIHVSTQPTITADWAGNPGEMIAQAESSIVPDVSAKGADVTWDFSGIQEIDTTRLPLLFVQADTTPFVDEFPGANQCLFTTDSDPEVGVINAYQYFEVSDTEWNILGNQVGNSLGSIGQIYSDPEKFLEFPMEYERAFSDLYAGETDLIVARTQFGGLSIVEADGYGTVMLPNGEFENCLRVTRSNAQRDTTDLGLGIIEVVVSGSTTHTWYNPNYPGPLAIYEESQFYTVAILDPLPPDTSETFFDTTFMFDPTAVISNVEEVDLAFFSMQVAPNPFTDAFVLNFELDSPEDVTIELYGMQGQLFHQQVSDGFVGTNTVTIAGDQLPSGIYTVVIRTDSKIASERVVKLE